MNDKLKDKEGFKNNSRVYLMKKYDEKLKSV